MGTLIDPPVDEAKAFGCPLLSCRGVDDGLSFEVIVTQMRALGNDPHIKCYVKRALRGQTHLGEFGPRLFDRGSLLLQRTP